MKKNMGTDAKEWAKKFVNMHGGDEELMTTWFANAIECGWDAGRNAANERHARHTYQRSHGLGQPY